MIRFAMMLVVALSLSVLPVLAQDESAMQPEGALVVQGHVLHDLGYVKRGKLLMLPIVEVAKASGHKVTFDAGKKVATFDGKVHVPVTMVEGHPYGFWHDMAPALKPLKMGLGPAKVVLFVPDPELQAVPPGH